MTKAFFKYYYDLTRYNFAFSLLISFIISPIGGIISFGTFGMLIGLFSYKYFQNNQYYFYYNLGLSKSKMISIVWGINFAIASAILMITR